MAHIREYPLHPTTAGGVNSYLRLGLAPVPKRQCFFKKNLD